MEADGSRQPSYLKRSSENIVEKDKENRHTDETLLRWPGLL